MIVTKDGDEALDMLRSTADESCPEVLLLDAMTPGASGPEVIAAFRRRKDSIPVLVVSAVSGISYDPDWQAADGFVGKPIDFGDLLDRIEALTSGLPRL